MDSKASSIGSKTKLKGLSTTTGSNLFYYSQDFDVESSIENSSLTNPPDYLPEIFYEYDEYPYDYAVWGPTRSIWSGVSGTDEYASVNKFIAPDNTKTAYKIIPSTEYGAHYLYQAVWNLEPNTPYTFSAYVKKEELQAVALEFFGSYDTFPNTVAAFDIGTYKKFLPSNSTLNGAYNPTITYLDNDWVRVSITQTTSSNSSNQYFRGHIGLLALDNSYNWYYNGTGAINPSTKVTSGSGLYVWGLQLEKGDKVNSYSKTMGVRSTFNPFYNIGNSVLSAYDFSSYARNGISSVKSIKLGGSTNEYTYSPIKDASGSVLLEDGNNSEHNIYSNNIGIASATTYAWTAYVKGLGREYIFLSPKINNVDYRTYFYCPNVTLSQNNILPVGSVGTNTLGNSASIQYVNHGWYKIQVVRPVSLGDQLQFTLGSAFSDNVRTYTGVNASSGFYAWGLKVAPIYGANTATPASFDIKAGYDWSYNLTNYSPLPAKGVPDTGYVQITNTGSSAFIGTIMLSANFVVPTGTGGPTGAYTKIPDGTYTNFQEAFPDYYTTTGPNYILDAGQSVAFFAGPESSNYGGINKSPIAGQPDNGIQIIMDGTVNGLNFNYKVLDKDIHSGVYKTNPLGVTLDNYILQGADPYGRDTGDSFETSLTPGHYQIGEYINDAVTVENTKNATYISYGVYNSNLLKYSEDFTKWGYYNASGLGGKTVISNLTSSPIGSFTADKITNTVSILQDLAFVDSSDTYTYSIYVHSASQPSRGNINPSFWFQNADTSQRISCGVVFNHQNGQYVSTGGTNPDLIKSYKSINVGNGWYRYIVTFQDIFTTPKSLRCEIYFNNSSDLTGNIIVWGAQLERGSGASPYIRTTSSPVISDVTREFISLDYAEPSLGLPNKINLFKYSQQFDNSIWNVVDGSNRQGIIQTTSVSDPFNSGSFAYKLVEQAASVGSAVHEALQIVPLGQNQTYTLSVYAKAAERNQIALFYNSYGAVVYNLATQNVSIQPTYGVYRGSPSGTITSVGNGWYRCTYTCNTSANNPFDVGIGVTNSLNDTYFKYVGNGSSGIYIWGAQLEVGSSATDYIYSGPTNGISFVGPFNSTTLTNTLYYLKLASKDSLHYKSRTFTGDDTLVIKNNNLGYNNPNPLFDLDINGNLQSSSGNISSKLSTNNLNVKNIQGFNNIQLNSNINSNNNFIFNNVSAQNVLTSAITAVSTLEVTVPVNILRSITITNSGYGYEYAPNVSITGGGSPVLNATATVSLNTTNGSISSVTITNPGIGYSTDPLISFTTNQTISYGITSISIKDISNNYYYTGFTKVPLVSAYKGSEYKTLSASAVLGSPSSTTLSSTVTSINILDAGYGYGYNLTPSIKLSSNIITTIPVNYINFGNVLSGASATGGITSLNLDPSYYLNNISTTNTTLSNALILDNALTLYLSANQIVVDKLIGNSSNIVYDLSSSQVNLIRYSEIFGFWNYLINCTVSDNYSYSPDNTKTATLLLEFGANPVTYSPRIETDISVDDINQIYTLSVYVSSAGQRYIEIDFRDVNNDFVQAGILAAAFDLQTGTIVNNGYSPNGYANCAGIGYKASITNYNNWYRCSISGNCKTTNGGAVVGKIIRPRIFLGRNDNHVSNSANGGLYLWGAQIEKSPSVTSYDKVVNYISTNKGIFGQNIHGKLDIDSNNFYYNNSNQLSTYSNKNVYLGIKPSDSYSSDNSSIVRYIGGPCDADSAPGVSWINKPYFKNLKGALEYAVDNGISGNSLNIYLFEDIIEGEDTSKALSPNASGVYCNQTFRGNLTGGYYSTEWLGSHYPELTSAGILGGHFYWGKNDEGSWGNIYSINYNDEILFKTINIGGLHDIGSRLNLDGSKYWDGRKPFDTASPRISIRSYACANPNRRFGDFGADAAERVYNFSTTIYARPNHAEDAINWNRPYTFGGNNKTINHVNLSFEFANNCSDNTSIWFTVKNSTLTISNVTIACKGPGHFFYSPMLFQNINGRNNIVGTRQLDPFTLSPYQWGKNLWQSIPGAGDPAYYPGYGVAIVGNDGKSTFQQEATNMAARGLVSFSSIEGSYIANVDYGQGIGPIGRDSPIQSSIILDGKLNGGRIFHLEGNCTLWCDNQIYKTSNFVLSSYNSSTDLTTRAFKYNYNSKFDFIPFNLNTGVYAHNIIRWGNTQLLSWNFIVSPTYLINTSYNSLLAVNNVNNGRFNATTKTYNYIDDIKPYANTPGAINYSINDITNVDNRTDVGVIRYVNSNQILNYDTPGLFTLTSPVCSTYTSTMVFYKNPTR